MAIFEITGTDIRALPKSNFAKESIRERDDLQRLLQKAIEHISPDTIILAEEFGSWEGSQRRIDLLGLNKECQLVVIELKRTEDGGHMELQALRYAAMVSSLSFEQAVIARRTYLAAKGILDIDAEADLLKFLEVDEPPPLASTVRIVLAAADFGKELTTAVLWLNSSGLDITCVKMAPYSYGDGRVLLDIQQVIPLPEAKEYQIAIRDKATEVEVARVKQIRDLTKYDLTVGREVHTKLPKRDLVYFVMAEGIRNRGLKPENIHANMPWRTTSLLIGFDGVLDAPAYQAELRKADRDPVRYFCAGDEIFHVDGRTYALTNQWNTSAEKVVEAVIALMGEPKTVTFSRHVTP